MNEQERDPFPEVDPDIAAETEAEGQHVAVVDAVAEARHRLVDAARQVLDARAEVEAAMPSAHAADEQQYAQELLALAARELVRATDALPEDEQPVGWTDTRHGGARAEVAAIREQLKMFFAGVQEAHTALAQAAYGPNPTDPAEALRKAIKDLAAPLGSVVVERTP